MTILISVDVETNGLDWFKHELLSIGAVAVIDGKVTEHTFYERLAYNPDNFDPETILWWGEQNKVAYDQAFTGVRMPKIQVAEQFANWVHKFGDEGEPKFFVANPAVFDWGWICRLFSDTGIPNPFHYRVMCLRSVQFGIAGEWGQSREGREPAIPHHALEDARAQAYDLQDLLEILDQK